MSFDPNMTYWQSLKIVAKGMALSPAVKRYEFEIIMEAACDLAGAIGAIVLRWMILAIFPISIPILTWLVQKDRALTAKRMKEAQHKMLDHQNHITRPTK